MEVQLSDREYIRRRKARSQSKNPEAFDRIGHLERCGYKIVQQVVPEKLHRLLFSGWHGKQGGSLRPGGGGFLAVYPNTYAERRLFFVPYPKGCVQKIVCHTFRDRSDVGQNGTFCGHCDLSAEYRL